MGDTFGWIGLGIGQLVAWPQVMKLRRDGSGGVSLLTYVLLLLSMALYLAHAIEIQDTVTMVSVPIAFVPNALIAVTLVRRRRAASWPGEPSPRIGASPTNGRSEEKEALERLRRRCAASFGPFAEVCCAIDAEEEDQADAGTEDDPMDRATISLAPMVATGERRGDRQKGGPPADLSVDLTGDLDPEGAHLPAHGAGSPLEELLTEELAGPPELRFHRVDRGPEKAGDLLVGPSLAES